MPTGLKELKLVEMRVRVKTGFLEQVARELIGQPRRTPRVLVTGIELYDDHYALLFEYKIEVKWDVEPTLQSMKEKGWLVD